MVLTQAFMMLTHIMVLVLKVRQLSRQCTAFFASDSPTANWILCGHKRQFCQFCSLNLLLKVQMKPAVKFGALAVPAVYKRKGNFVVVLNTWEVWVTRNHENVWWGLGDSSNARKLTFFFRLMSSLRSIMFQMDDFSKIKQNATDANKWQEGFLAMQPKCVLVTRSGKIVNG